MTKEKPKPQKTSPLPVLRSIYSEITLTDINSIDPYSVNTTHIYDVVRTKAYNAIVDWACVFHTIFDIFQKQRDAIVDEKLSDEQIKKLAQDTHNFLLSLPLQYDFLLPLPKGLPLKDDFEITKDIHVIKISENERQKYKQANPTSKALTVGALQRLLAGNEETRDKLTLPNTDDTYLKISCRGYVGRGNTTVYGVDPIYIYKVFFSLNYAMGNFSVERTPHSPSMDTFAQYAFKAYDASKKFTSTITRPNDEAKLINQRIFKEGLRQEQLLKTLNLFKALITEPRLPENNKLRNQILNSLFWYFETCKTENPNMQTVFFTSVFDAFFDQDEKSRVKINMISLECSKSPAQQEHAKTELKDLYDARNEIIHGEKPLFDYHIDGKKAERLASARINVSATIFYNRFLTSKFNRLTEGIRLDV